ncbi:MAG: nuclear transport factor 2 family protein [Methanomicrobiales archaeon]|nr:nuclear transport factor 2 family protein [Methanomicrobiales archaeon]
MTLNEAATKEVLAVLDTYVQYYNEKNLSGVLTLFAKDTSGFGTGKDEVITGYAGLKDQLKLDFNPSNTIRVKMRVIATGGVMPAAWITAFCDFDGTIAGKSAHMEGRMTAVLANHGGRWLFEQVHFSVPGQ